MEAVVQAVTLAGVAEDRDLLWGGVIDPLFADGRRRDRGVALMPPGNRRYGGGAARRPRREPGPGGAVGAGFCGAGSERPHRRVAGKCDLCPIHRRAGIVGDLHCDPRTLRAAGNEPFCIRGDGDHRRTCRRLSAEQQERCKNNTVTYR